MRIKLLLRFAFSLSFCVFLTLLFPAFSSSLLLGASAEGGVEGVDPLSPGFLDHFSCLSSPYATSDGVAVGDGGGRVSTANWFEVPCLDLNQISLSSSHGLRSGDILLLLDIDDTLISSGDWSAVMGKSLGGTDGRYPRGSEYPGLAAVLYLLALGPHTYDLNTKAILHYTYPLNVMMVTARPNISLFRPSHLIPHINFLLTRGVQQVHGLQVPARKTLWSVGSENVISPVHLIKGKKWASPVYSLNLQSLQVEKTEKRRLGEGCSHIARHRAFSLVSAESYVVVYRGSCVCVDRSSFQYKRDRDRMV